MKQSIKIASLVLAMVMTLTLLTACSGGGGGGGGGNTGGSTGGSAGGGSSADGGTGGSGDNKGDTPGGGSTGGSSEDDDEKDGLSILWKDSLLSEVYSGNDNIIQKKFVGTDSRTRTPFKAMYGVEESNFVTYLSGSNGTYIMFAKDIYDGNTDFEIWKVNEDSKEYTVVNEMPEGYDWLYILCDGPKQESNPTVTAQWETYKNTKYYTEHAVILDNTGMIDCVYFYPTQAKADVRLVKLRQGSGRWVYLENMDVREGTVEISNATNQNIFDRTERQLMDLENYKPEENGGTGGDKPGIAEKEVSWADSRLGSIYSMADRSNIKFYGTNSNTGKQEIFLGGRNNSLNKTVVYWDVDAGRYLANRDKNSSASSIEVWKLNEQNQYITREDDASAFANVNQIWDLLKLASGPYSKNNQTVLQSRETYNGTEYYTEKAKIEMDDGTSADCTYYYTNDTAADLSDIQMIKVETTNQKPYYLTGLTMKMSSAGIDASVGNIFTARERKWLDPDTYTPKNPGSTGGDKEEDEKETWIPWSQSRTSKVYYMDEPRNNGAMSVKFCATDASTGKRGVYAWVSNPDIKKIILYYSDPDGTMLWQVDMKTWEDEFWEIEGNTYTVWDGSGSGPFGGYAGEAEIIADGPESAKNSSVVSAMRTYRNQEYYTETAYITGYRGKTFKCTYYYPKTASAGKSLNDIQIIRVDVSTGKTVYLTDVDARISNEYVNSEKSIFTKKQQEALDPRNYTEAKE